MRPFSRHAPLARLLLILQPNMHDCHERKITLNKILVPITNTFLRTTVITQSIPQFTILKFSFPFCRFRRRCGGASSSFQRQHRRRRRRRQPSSRRRNGLSVCPTSIRTLGRSARIGRRPSRRWRLGTIQMTNLVILLSNSFCAKMDTSRLVLKLNLNSRPRLVRRTDPLQGSDEAEVQGRQTGRPPRQSGRGKCCPFSILGQDWS